MYYFAYGSNMNHEQMKKRCPSSCFINKVFLKGCKFVYDGSSASRDGAVANILETGKEEDIVWGGLFKINEDNLAALDCFEGYLRSPKVYDKKEVEVRDDEGSSYTAIVYFRTGKDKGQPSIKYRKTVIEGAREDCKLPEDYTKNNL